MLIHGHHLSLSFPMVDLDLRVAMRDVCRVPIMSVRGLVVPRVHEKDHSPREIYLRTLSDFEGTEALRNRRAHLLRRLRQQQRGYLGLHLPRRRLGAHRRWGAREAQSNLPGEQQARFTNMILHGPRRMRGGDHLRLRITVRGTVGPSSTSDKETVTSWDCNGPFLGPVPALQRNRRDRIDQCSRGWVEAWVAGDQLRVECDPLPHPRSATRTVLRRWDAAKDYNPALAYFDAKRAAAMEQMLREVWHKKATAIITAVNPNYNAPR